MKQLEISLKSFSIRNVVETLEGTEKTKRKMLEKWCKMLNLGRVMLSGVSNGITKLVLLWGLPLRLSHEICFVNNSVCSIRLLLRLIRNLSPYV